MARYIVSAHTGASGFRPWHSRLVGVGDYQRANIVIPTQSQVDEPGAGAVTGGLGAFDFSQIPGWAWLAAAGVGLWWFTRKR